MSQTARVSMINLSLVENTTKSLKYTYNSLIYPTTQLSLGSLKLAQHTYLPLSKVIQDRLFYGKALNPSHIHTDEYFAERMGCENQTWYC